MKVTTIFCLCLALGGSLQQTLTPTTCSLTDLKNNNNTKALNFLKAKGVQLYSEPNRSVEATVCGGEFTIYGTCCDIATLKTYATQANSRIAGKWKKYIAKLVRIRNKLVPGLNKILAKSTLADIKNKITEIKSNNPNLANAKFANIELLVPENDVDISNLKNFFINFDTALQGYKNDGKACFDALRTVRSNLLCAACSARASNISTYSDEFKSYLYFVDYNSSQNIVHKCFGVWNFNHKIFQAMTVVSVVLAKKKGLAGGSGINNEVQIPSNLIGELRAFFRMCSISVNSITKAQSLVCTGTNKPIDELYSNTYGIFVSANYQNAMVEGDESIDSGVSDDEVVAADSEITVTKRVLQAGQEDYVDFKPVAYPPSQNRTETSSSIFLGVSYDNSSLVPTESVITDNSGDSPKSSVRLAMCWVLVFVMMGTYMN